VVSATAAAQTLFRDVSRLRLPLPLLFHIENERRKTSNGVPSRGGKTKAPTRQFCGVMEFSADKDKCFIPSWMMKNLKVRDGGRVLVKSQRGVSFRARPTIARSRSAQTKKGEWAKLRPHTMAFVELASAVGPREILEVAFRNYSALSTGETLSVSVAGERFLLDVLEVKPSSKEGGVVCLYGDLDLEVEFAPPKDAPPSPERPATDRSAAPATPERAEEDESKSAVDAEEQDDRLVSLVGKAPGGAQNASNPHWVRYQARVRAVSWRSKALAFFHRPESEVDRAKDAASRLRLLGVEASRKVDSPSRLDQPKRADAGRFAGQGRSLVARPAVKTSGPRAVSPVVSPSRPKHSSPPRAAESKQQLPRRDVARLAAPASHRAPKQDPTRVPPRAVSSVRAKDQRAAMEDAMRAQEGTSRHRKPLKTAVPTSGRAAVDAEEAMVAAAIAASLSSTPMGRAVGSSSTSEALKLARAAQAEADEAYARSLQQRLNRGRVGAPVVSSRLYPSAAAPGPTGRGMNAAKHLRPKKSG
jgi:hypothetical protein